MGRPHPQPAFFEKALGFLEAASDAQARLERMPGDRLLALATGHGAIVSYTQCVRDRPLAPATEADPFRSMRGRTTASMLKVPVLGRQWLASPAADATSKARSAGALTLD